MDKNQIDATAAAQAAVSRMNQRKPLPDLSSLDAVDKARDEELVVLRLRSALLNDFIAMVRNPTHTIEDVRAYAGRLEAALKRA
jgi:hypothetical protein